MNRDFKIGDRVKIAKGNSIAHYISGIGIVTEIKDRNYIYSYIRVDFHTDHLHGLLFCPKELEIIHDKILEDD